jgi:hypothetical protein
METFRRVRRGKLLWISWTIQPGQRLATRPELNLMYIEVTRYTKLKERRMISHNASEGFYSPEICLVALGQGFLHSEASIAAHDNGECVSGVPGSQTMAGHSTVHSGTREDHIVPKEASDESKRRRRKYGGMVVGPGHIRVTDGVMPTQSRKLGHSKGLAAKCRGMSSVCHTLKWITSRWQYCPPITTGSKGMLQYSWQGPSE